MKIALVKPPEKSRFNFGTFSLAVLAAAVEDIAAIRITDATDLTLGAAVAEILAGSPDCIGITAMGPSSVQPVNDLIKELRCAGFGGTVIAGGHGATMFPAHILSSGADAVVMGEGEETFRDIVLSGVSERINGIALSKDGRVVQTERRALIDPLDLLKKPARHLTAPPPDGVYLLETSRGCPHGCAFCETTRFYGRRWRARSPARVADDIVSLAESGAQMIQIADDNFTAGAKRVREICRLLESRPLPLFMMFFARSDDIVKAPDLAGKLAGAHFLRASVGVETTNPELSGIIKKDIPLDKHTKAFSLMAGAGIFSVASIIIGLPGETDDMRRTYVEDVVSMGADSVFFLPFQPLPGTPLGTETGEPDPVIVQEASRLTAAFESHPVVMQRMAKLSEEPTVRGLLARAAVARRAAMKRE